MMQLCRIKEATCRVELTYEQKTKERKSQTMDPRVPKEVLIEQGISPNPGPRRHKTGNSKLGKLALFMTNMLAMADSRSLGNHAHIPKLLGQTCVCWTLV